MFPRNLDALTGAGRAALAIGDANAAISFFARAQEIAPADGRIKAGLASALVQMEQPKTALTLFDRAVALGVPEAEIASDRGLARDLRGDTRRAQADYALALRGGADDETTRRLAVSQAISGDRAAALATLDGLLRRQDRAAWRVHAFVLALTGDRSGAEQAALTVMPRPQAQAMAPFFSRLASLRPGEKAAAVNLGQLPAEGRSYASRELFAEADLAASPAAPPPGPRSDVPLIPTGQPLGGGTVLADADGVPSRAPRRRPGEGSEAVPSPVAPTVTAAAPVRTGSTVQERMAFNAPIQPTAAVAPTVAAIPIVAAPTYHASFVMLPAPPRAAGRADRSPAGGPDPRRDHRDHTRADRHGRAGFDQCGRACIDQPGRVRRRQSGAGRREGCDGDRDRSGRRTIASGAGNAGDFHAGRSARGGRDPAVEIPGSGLAESPAVVATRFGPALAGSGAARRVRPSWRRPRRLARSPPPRRAWCRADPLSRATPIPMPRPAVDPEPVHARPVRVNGAREKLALDAAKPSRDTAPDQPGREPAVRRPRRGQSQAGWRAHDGQADAGKDKLAKGEADRAIRDKAARDKAARDKAAAATAGAGEGPADKATGERYWVQVASGANKSDLGRAWQITRTRAPKLLVGRPIWTTPWKQSNRLLVGPFKSDDEAQDFVNALGKAGMGSMQFTSRAGTRIERMAGNSRSVRLDLGRHAGHGRGDAPPRPLCLRSGEEPRPPPRRARRRRVRARRLPARPRPHHPRHRLPPPAPQGRRCSSPRRRPLPRPPDAQPGVAQIGRTMARSLGLNEDLTEALCLAHDIGHPPFGHSGEAALKAACAPAGGFDHNAHTLRVLTRLETPYPRWDGLNLTWETLEGSPSINGPVADPTWALAEVDAEMPLDLAVWPSLEAQVAAVADDIAYDNHDIDDGLRAGLLEMEALLEVPLVAESWAAVRARFPEVAPARLRPELIREQIGRMVADVLAETRARIAAAGVGSAADVRAAGRELAGFSAAMAPQERVLKRFMYARLYHHPLQRDVAERARGVVAGLAGAYLADPALLPAGWRDRLPAEDPWRTRHIADFIAGMTDRYAITRYREAVGPVDMPEGL